MSAKTLELHHGKHHRGYVDKLNQLAAGTPFESMTLIEVVRASHVSADDEAIFNNAAQHLNHSTFWTSLKPNGGGNIPPRLEQRLVTRFGSLGAFKDAFINMGLSQFGSGWVWLIERDGHLQIRKTPNAGTPIVEGQKVLLVCDVWEHAYYVDYENRRREFLTTFLERLVDWDSAAALLNAG
jgi:Fe-Mn family superoxide dismutase